MDPEHNQYVSYGPARGDAQRLPYAFKVDVGASPFPTRLVVGVLPAQVTLPDVDVSPFLAEGVLD